GVRPARSTEDPTSEATLGTPSGPSSHLPLREGEDEVGAASRGGSRLVLSRWLSRSLCVGGGVVVRSAAAVLAMLRVWGIGRRVVNSRRPDATVSTRCAS